MNKRRWSLWIGIIALSAIVLASGCSSKSLPAARDWMDIELADVRTGQTFRIGDFSGKPILLESFAVWCPTCLRQQNEIKNVKSSEGDDIVHISLDTDPNEDVNKVREHLDSHDFDWYFAVAPIELTNALVDDFGLSVVNAPSAPVILICEDQSSRMLRNGVKSADDLVDEIQKGCQ